MKCSDVPSFARFEAYVRQNGDDPNLVRGFREVTEALASAPRPLTNREMAMDPGQMLKLKASCEAVEKATRIMWACAAASDNIEPPMWEEIPDYESALDYFNQLTDLELMAATEEYRLRWEVKRQSPMMSQRPGG
ncbi:MAG: hypothetical protein SNJ84_07290 [Verrucomicrobiia bacterium]